MSALREILAHFGVSFDDTELKKGDKAVDGVVKKLADMGKLLAGGLIVKGIADFITGMADQADQLNDQAAALGVSTSELQEWQYAAKLSGVEAGELNGALTKFNKNVADAAAGTGPAADTFRALGVSVKDSAGKLGQPIDLLEGIANGIQKIQNPAERTQALMSLFGKSGSKLGPLFDQGAEGIAKFRAEVAELGGGLSPDFIDGATEMNDSIDRLNFAWLSFKARLGGLVIPLANRFVLLATKAAVHVSKWADALAPLVNNSNLAIAAAVALGAAFLVAGAKAILPWLPMIAALAAAFLLLDELITLWQGGDTLIGRAIDNLFGEGSAKKLVAFGHTIADMFSQAGDDGEAFYRVIDGVWKGIVLAASIAAETVRKLWVGVGATIYDALNTPLRNKKNAEIDEQIAQAKTNAAATPNSEEWLKRRIAELESQKEKTQGEINEETSAKNAAQFVEQYERLSKQLDPKLHSRAARAEADMRATGLIGPPSLATTSVPSSTTVAPSTTISVTVPPGTSANMANDVAQKVKQVLPSTKALQNQLVKTAG